MKFKARKVRISHERFIELCRDWNRKRGYVVPKRSVGSSVRKGLREGWVSNAKI